MERTTFVKELEITNAMGMHLRPMAQFVRLSQTFPCQVSVHGRGRSANGKSLLDLALVSGPKGMKIEVRTIGEEAEDCLNALARLVAGKFGETDPEAAL